MGERMECPVCGGYSSTVLIPYMDGEGCGFCGASNALMDEVRSIRDGLRTLKARERLAQLAKRAKALEAENVELRRILSSVENDMADYRRVKGESE